MVRACYWVDLASPKAGGLDGCPGEPSPSLGPASSIGVKPEQAGAAWAPQISRVSLVPSTKPPLIFCACKTGSLGPGSKQVWEASRL